MAENLPYLFEASWEVCNKVGGIYTVVTSKLAQTREAYPNRYLAIGPYLGESSDNNPTFQAKETPEYLWPVFEEASNRGVNLHFGTWLVDGEPDAILVDWSPLVSKNGDFKKLYWEKYQLDSLNSDFYDVDQPMLWSTAIGIFAQIYHQKLNRLVDIQVHEWMTGGSILYLRSQNEDLSGIRCVFTTHATVLGRALCSRNIFIYDKFDQLEQDSQARSLGVITKHQIERISAQKAESFTTVSQITAEEATAFLGRKPDVITENGLDTESFPDFAELSIMRQKTRRLLEDFIAAYFFPSYRFDLSRTYLQFSIGRYEMHNKGYDLYLQALAELNQQLIREKSSKTIVSFFLIPGDAGPIRPETQNQLKVYRYIKQILDNLGNVESQKLYTDLCENRRPSASLPNDTQAYLRQLMAHLSRDKNPEISPYYLNHPDQDQILNQAKAVGLNNSEEDRVKIVFFPIYFEGFDGIFNIPFYELLAGFDLGVFPSFYEPWGYTPMESLAMGVPAITCNLAGFGRSCEEKRKINSYTDSGVMILNRRRQESRSLNDLVDMLQLSIDETSREWLNRRISAYQIIQTYSWSLLFDAYKQAYNRT